jgi:phage shock protein PspC (stress-responsive transcriptional regulator)
MNRFILNRQEGKLMGVAAGLADSFNTDPLLVRLGLIAAVLVTGPVAIVFYLAAVVLAPSAKGSA